MHDIFSAYDNTPDVITILEKNDKSVQKRKFINPILMQTLLLYLFSRIKKREYKFVQLKKTMKKCAAFKFRY